MSRGGLQPFGEYFTQRAAMFLGTSRLLLFPCRIYAVFNNVTSPIYGLPWAGLQGLLVSESKLRKSRAPEILPKYDFVTCDYFPELMNASGQNKKVDIIWDV